MKVRSQILFYFTLLAVLLAFVGCGVAQARGKTTVIRARDFAFEAPASMVGGVVTVRLENEGQTPHHAQFARVKDEYTLDEFMQTLASGALEAFGMVTYEGGPAVVPPGGQQEVILDLPSGQYVLLSFVPDSEGVPGLAKGMVTPIEVTEPGTAAPTVESSLTVSLQDFSIELPATVGAGKQVWEIVNKGPQIHEMNLIRLGEGKTMDDVAAWFEIPNGPPPFIDAGGFQALEKDGRGWVTLNLDPGTYVALCHVPDDASGIEHAQLGMVRTFRVR